MLLQSLTLALGWVAAAASPPERTVWLVRPLYSDQQALATRTEEAIQQVLGEESRASEVIGRKQLAAALTGRDADITCVLGEAECRDPLDALIASLGFSRVVFVKSGRDDAGYRFKVASYRPNDGNVSTAEGTGATFERALFGALVKVVPLTSMLKVNSTPPGATVYVDNENVGTTPLSTQVLPGRRAIKLDLPGYKPAELAQLVTVRGQISVQRELEKVPARLILSTTPTGAEIYVDGKWAGKDKVDQGVLPGSHVIRMVAPEYVPHQVSIDIKSDETFTLHKALQPKTFLGMQIGVAQEDIYRRKSSFDLAFESVSLKGDGIHAKHQSNSLVRTDRLLSPSPAAAHLLGVSAEYNTYGRYFGLTVIGLLYARQSNPWMLQVINNDPDQGQPDGFVASVRMLTVRALQPQLRLALWRFTVSVQGGLEVRGVRIRTGEAAYTDGFFFVDTQVAGQGALRLFLYEGLFLEGAYRYSATLFSLHDGTGPAMQGLRAGAGYAF